MFSQKTNDRLIDEQSKYLIAHSPLGPSGNRVFLPGFRLQDHSISQVSQANAHLDSLREFNPETKKWSFSRAYNTEEIRWIRNERSLSRIDFVYWATRYALIQDNEGRTIRFLPNKAQTIVLSIMAEMEEAEIAILLQILKARQMGVTTLSELLVLWKTMFYPGTNSLVGSSRPDKTIEMVGKMDFCYQNQPYWMIPEIVTNNSSVIGFDKQDSYINLSHGAVMSGMGRGSTVTCFHLSEVSGYLHPKEDIDAALLRAAHDSTSLIGLLESTADGRVGWWYDSWQFNIAFYPLGQSRLRPVFLPWYVADDLYPTKAWVRAHPVPKDHKFEELTSAHAKRARDYVQSGENPLLMKVLGEDWEMPAEQMWFWEVTRREAQYKKELHLFYQELCADDKEAFQSHNPSVFDSELIYEIRERAPRPYGVYGILAPHNEIPVKLQPKESDVDRNRKPLDIVASWNPMQPKHNYRLVPLLHRGSAPFDPMGKIIMYEPPMVGEQYGIGTDTGFGIGKDNTVLEGIRKGSLRGPATQVFEFASPNMNSFNVWPINLALGTLYSTQVKGRIRQAKQVIEGAANGENVFNELKKRGWREFHNWVRYDRKQIIEAAANRQLWYTNSWSRPLALDMLLDAINNNWLKVNSPYFLDEMADFELDELKMRLQASSGKHDDRIMSMAIVLFSMHAMDTKHNDIWMGYNGLEEEHEPEYPKYSPGAQGKDPRGSDPSTSYNYRVVRAGDPRYEELSKV